VAQEIAGSNPVAHPLCESFQQKVQQGGEGGSCP
jgi:hypothetical protein